MGSTYRVSATGSKRATGRIMEAEDMPDSIRVIGVMDKVFTD